MDQRSFAERLGDAMRTQGLKQVDLLRIAANQGVKLGKSQLSQYLSGKTIPRREMLSFLSATLGADLEPTGGPASSPAKTGGTRHARSQVRQVQQARPRLL